MTDVVDLARLYDIAADIMTQAEPGSVVWLSGELGSGKTAFVRAAVQAIGGEPASSPTYALVHEYQTPIGLVIHVDCYRLTVPEEAIDLDLRELQRGARVLFVEWPERAAEYAPSPDVHLRFFHAEAPEFRGIERVQ